MKRLWLGGSPCAGKSSIATMLAKRHNALFYQVDEQFDSHMKRSTIENQPTFHRLNQLAGDALWLRPFSEQVKDEIAYCSDQFGLVLEDLEHLPKERLIIVEGTSLLPHGVAPFLASPNEAIWLVPTEAFQRHHYAQRDWAKGVVAYCSDPEQAWENWMQRDALFGKWVAAEAARLGLRCLEVDGSIGLEQMALQVEEWLTL